MLSEEPNFRALIVNPFPIGANNPTGITMRNNFKGLKPNRVFQIYFHECRIIDGNEYKSIKANLSLSLFKKIKLRTKKFADNIKNVFPPHLLNINKKIDSKSDIKLINTGKHGSVISSWVDIVSPIYISPEIKKKIIEFRPTVVYTQGYNLRVLKYASRIASDFDCKLVLHTLDDWMTPIYSDNFLASIPREMLKKKIEKIVNNGKKHIVANPILIDEMKNRYGGDYAFVMNCVDLNTNNLEINKREMRKSFRIVYAGGLMLERWKALIDIGKCVESINSTGGNIIFDVYSPNEQIASYKKYLDKYMNLHEYVDQDNLIKIMSNCDLLVHVESFNENVWKYTKFSLSTKVPECLTAKKPFLYYGPKEVGVSKFLTLNKIGLCTNNVDELMTMLDLIINDNKYRDDLALKGYIFAKDVFDKEKMQSILVNCLNT